MNYIMRIRLGFSPSSKSLISITRKIFHKCQQQFDTISKYSFTTSSCKLASSYDDPPISRFPIPDRKTLPTDLKEILEANLEKTGFIPNVFQVLSHRPEEFRAFFGYYNAVMNPREGGNLTKADKELIIVAISAHNKCKYCIIAHSAMFRIFSKDAILADEVAANWETANIDKRQQAILEFAMDVGLCTPLKEERFQALYEHGLTQEDAWDIGAVVAFFSLSNRMAYLTNMPANKEFHLMGRVPKTNEKK